MAQKNCYMNVNDSLLTLDPKIVEYAIGVNVVLFFILVCVAIKKRRVANLFIYTELAFRLAVLFKPNSRSEQTTASMYMLETWAVVFATYCGDRKSFVLAFILVMLQSFVGVHWVYKNPLTPFALVLNIFVLFNFGLISSIVLTTLHYI